MRRAVVAPLALAAALACAPAALADQTVQAVDGTSPDGTDNRWSPNAVTVKVGEPVTWSFAGTATAHNVRAQSANWSFESEVGVAMPPAVHAFDAPGTYEFVCRLHASMRGAVTVTDETGAPPPPPPPPPLSEQPFANDQAAPTVLEVTDEIPPALTRVRVGPVARGVRIRFRLSEPGEVTIAILRGRRTLKTRSVTARDGANSATVRGLRAGHYSVRLGARDRSGNPARPQVARLTVRSQ